MLFNVEYKNIEILSKINYQNLYKIGTFENKIADKFRYVLCIHVIIETNIYDKTSA